MFGGLLTNRSFSLVPNIVWLILFSFRGHQRRKHLVACLTLVTLDAIAMPIIGYALHGWGPAPVGKTGSK
jgi:hypothetical protein